MTRRLLAFGAIVCALGGIGPTADAQLRTTRGEPVGFSARGLAEQSLSRDSAAALGALPAAMSARAGTVLLFALLGATLGTLLALEACSVVACMTFLPVMYGGALGAAAGALVGLIISAVY
ncbi:MAG TPA: hypothetical protein VJ717_00850 [Gemmatimonadaceae bacterium]|nr:hypothetical protein [Gemmatimonadaceae bacterium]